MDNNLVVQFVLPAALFLVMLGVGMSLNVGNFKALFETPKAIIVGVASQLVLLPLMGFIVTLLFSLPPFLAIGLMILTFAPGGATSNLITYLSRGDTALSVCLTSITGLITPFTLPVLTPLVISFWLGESQVLDFPVVQTIAKLLAIGVLPVIIGVSIHYKWPIFCLKIKHAVKFIASAFLVLVVLGIIKASWPVIVEQITKVGLAALVLSTSAMLIGFMIARKASLTNEQGVAFSAEIGIQNAGIALLVTEGVIGNSEMSVSPLIYGVIMNVPIIVLIIYRNWPAWFANKSSA